MADSLWPGGGLGDWILFALALYGLFSLVIEVLQLLLQVIRGTRQVGLSVLVLVHNQEHQIEGLVRSLARQGWGSARDWELVLVDLDSSDDTPLILERLARQFEHIRLVRLPRDHVHSVCDTALFLCRSPVTLLVDLRYGASANAILAAVRSKW